QAAHHGLSSLQRAVPAALDITRFQNAKNEIRSTSVVPRRSKADASVGFPNVCHFACEVLEPWLATLSAILPRQIPNCTVGPLVGVYEGTPEQLDALIAPVLRAASDW